MGTRFTCPFVNRQKIGLFDYGVVSGKMNFKIWAIFFKIDRDLIVHHMNGIDRNVLDAWGSVLETGKNNRISSEDWRLSRELHRRQGRLVGYLRCMLGLC